MSGDGWLRDAIEAAAWDGLAQRIDQRTLAHLWAWEQQMREIDGPYDWQKDGL